MNPHLTRLLALMNAARVARGDHHIIKRAELIAALQLLSAPYSLEACALYCERFLSIVAARPMFIPVELADAGSQLALLREVVLAGAADPYFSKSHLPVSSATPLHPYTGDGPIVDVLMLEAYLQETRREFRGLVEWFVWLGLHYQHRHVTATAYAAYLDGSGAQSERLIHEVDASVLVEAGRALRRLASPEEEVARNALTALGLELTEARGKYLASLARVVYGSPAVSKIQIRRWMQSTGLAEADARTELERMRYRVAGPLRHLLRSLWGVDGESRASGVRRRMHATIRHYSRPRVTRYRGFIEEITPLDQDDPDSPVSVTIYPVKPPPKRERRRGAWVDEGEDPDEPDGDAGSQIYAGRPDDNPITSYYKAKGYRYHTEYLNALLPWSRTRLGTTALRFLVAALGRCDGDTVAIRAVKLVVFLSLVTGRSLTDVCTVSVQCAMESGTAQDADLLLSLPERNLYVRAAEPFLVRRRREPLAGILHTHGRYLVLALPVFVVDLLGDGDSPVVKRLAAQGLIREARAWLAAQPARMGIRSESVRNALVFVLLEQNRGDLGLVKLITDRQGLNFQNIIHYAAYPVDRANKMWARAVDQLLGMHLTVPRTAMSGGDPDAYAGTPDAPNLDLLRVELGRLRARLRACLAGQDPDRQSGSKAARLDSAPRAQSQLGLAIRGHNLLTLYSLLWVNLATAGRARVAPAPVALLGDVALVADKHREDGSTDRLVPLTPGVLAQLRTYFAYVWQLGFRRPQFRPIADAFATGVLQFQFLNRRGDVVDYRPKWLYENEHLLSLPGNWARKLVRQQLINIGGRFLDAGMGHWVAGRHPYRVTSTFAFASFRKAWLRGQTQLEQQLGFTVIGHPDAPGDSGAVLRVWPVARGLTPPPRPRPGKRPAGEAVGPVSDKPEAMGAADASAGSERHDAATRAGVDSGSPGLQNTGDGLSDVAASQRATSQSDAPAVVSAQPVTGQRTSGDLQRGAERSSEAPMLNVDFEAECRLVDAPLYDALCAAAQKRERSGAEGRAEGEPRLTRRERIKLATGLITALLHRHGETASDARVYEHACCVAAQKHWKVSVFAASPRSQFQHDWLTDEFALSNLAYFRQRILPAFAADLAHLPRPSEADGAGMLELGRLVMLCIWRQGLVTWPVLDAFLQGYYRNGILATGRLRYVPSSVRCRRNGAAMERLVYLEPYTQVYLVAESARLRALLRPLLAPLSSVSLQAIRAAHQNGDNSMDGGDPAVTPPESESAGESEAEEAAGSGRATTKPAQPNSQIRRARLQNALRQYLRSLRVPGAEFGPHGNLLTMTLAAARQYHLLHGSPVLAAYAAAEFETHDLPDAEIRRLAGYAERTTHAGGATPEESLEGTDFDRLPFPAAELPVSEDIVHQLAHHRSAYFEQLQQSVAGVAVEEPRAKLLQAFALWYLRRQAKPKNGKLEQAEKLRFRRTIEVVGYALFGFAKAEGPRPVIDEAFLVSLQEELRDLAPHVGGPAPFQAFRRFLRQHSNVAVIEKLGFGLGDIEPANPRGVLAKVVTPACISAVAANIPRVGQSGIGNPTARVAAQRHLQSIAVYGMRRTEAEYLRGLDVQGDLIRVQPYGEHTLKTAWSERVLPRRLAELAGLTWLDTANGDTTAQLLTNDLGTDAHGFNYYAHVNQLLQQLGGDPEVHLHSVRHTVASRLMLSMLSESVNYEHVLPQFPWLEEFLLPKVQIDLLLGGEGQSGHGLQAIAALLGHSHPLTTLRHYIHTVGIAFYAHLCGLPCPDLLHAFEYRMASARTMQRRMHEWRALTLGLAPRAAHRHIQPRLLAVAEALFPDVVSAEEPLEPDPQKRSIQPEVLDFRASAPPDARGVDYDRLERVDGLLRGELADASDVDVAAVEHALDRIFDIPSGRRGSASKRHPCVTVNGRQLPQRLQAGSPTRVAAQVGHWLEQLRTSDVELFDWLLQRWLYASEREFGRMRLKPDEAARWERLLRTDRVEPWREQKVFKRQPGSGRSDRVQTWGRIRCKSGDKRWLRKDVPAVRWVMTWAAALRLAHMVDVPRISNDAYVSRRTDIE